MNKSLSLLAILAQNNCKHIAVFFPRTIQEDVITIQLKESSTTIQLVASLTGSLALLEMMTTSTRTELLVYSHSKFLTIYSASGETRKSSESVQFHSRKEVLLR